MAGKQKSVNYNILNTGNDLIQPLKNRYMKEIYEIGMILFPLHL